MKGYRKLFFGCFLTIAYIYGCWLTEISVEGGIFVTIGIITIGGNAIEHLPKVMASLARPPESSGGQDQ